MAIQKVLIRRTETPNFPPTGLLPGELSVEMSTPTRLWVGVPMTIDPAGKKLLYDSSAAAPVGDYVQRSGDTMTGFLTLSANPTATMHSVTKAYCDLKITQAQADTLYVKRAGDTMTGELLNLVNVKSMHFTVRAAATGANQNAQYRFNDNDDTARGLLWQGPAGDAGFQWNHMSFQMGFYNSGFVDFPWQGWKLQTVNVKCYVDPTGTYNILQMSDNFAWHYNRVDGHLYLKYSGTNYAIWYNNGNHYQAGVWVAKPGGGPWADSSDARIKDVLGEYDQGLEAVLALRPVIYKFKGNDFLPDQKPFPIATGEGRDAKTEMFEPRSLHHEAAKSGKEFIGLIAQEAEIPMPEMVSYLIGVIEGVPITDLRALDTGPLLYALVNAVKTLHKRIEALEGGAQPKEG